MIDFYLFLNFQMCFYLSLFFSSVRRKKGKKGKLTFINNKGNPAAVKIRYDINIKFISSSTVLMMMTQYIVKLKIRAKGKGG